MEVLRSFLVKKGLVSEEELQNLLESEELDEEITFLSRSDKVSQEQPKQKNTPVKEKQGKDLNSLSSGSDVTIYKRAVQQIAPQLGNQIEQYITNIRKVPS